MESLQGLLAFVKTVDGGSFVAAARVLEVSASAIGKSVARLEQEAGVRLLQRSTRRLHLTDEGRVFYQRCKTILDELDDARAELGHSANEPSGRLRLCAPIVAQTFLAPWIGAFVVRYPQLELDLHFSDHALDLVEEGLDLAIRSGDLPDSRWVSRPLHGFRLQLYAAPSYLARCGEPRSLEALEQHAAVRFRHPGTGRLLDWPLCQGSAQPRIRTALACNYMEAVRNAAIQGLGLACMPDFLAQEPLASGALRPVLTEAVGAQGRYHALWPSSRHMPRKVRVAVDALAAHFAPFTPPGGAPAVSAGAAGGPP